MRVNGLRIYTALEACQSSSVAAQLGRSLGKVFALWRMALLRLHPLQLQPDISCKSIRNF